MNPTQLPIFYSYRRCPYAMRARLALRIAGIPVQLREIDLRQKPAAMLTISPKGTVPVLQLQDGRVIEESLEIMLWAQQNRDPLQAPELFNHADAEQLISWNDGQFKYWLDRYKYADRYPEQPQSAYRQQAEKFLAVLEERLQQHCYLCGAEFALADAAILPFIRQFAAVEPDWLPQAPYPRAYAWLSRFNASGLFAGIMQKYPVWQSGDAPSVFPDMLIPCAHIDR